MEQQREFTGVWIPKHIIEDESLKPNEVFLYAEITALCGSKGYCNTKNRYFAELFGKSIPTISVWIRSLKEKGFIRYELNQENGSTRKIYLIS